MRGEYDRALPNLEQSLEFFRAAGDQLGEANVFLSIGVAQCIQGQYSRALQSLEQAQEHYGLAKNQLGVANALREIGNVQYH